MLQGQRLHAEICCNKLFTKMDAPENGSTTVTVAVASRSKPKLAAARSGFSRLLPPGCSLILADVDVESGVSSMPMSLQETRQGALNRLGTLQMTEVGRSADFCISFEGGVD